ncbi:hypothetical protein [Flavobacterium reichenbachii]|uniref:Lipoprotein n=1 Tax=Flavobacterium reichenbachii TaxID=362418 RepID=A0A085ZGC1_9FLAO|nr:hypothetical protein [Flavobacterium reichenbachii]KFF03485.1 hypothetical protein IW19_21635 [Flavobacterium reichenbachii]OXB15692.1 hypothetical protein B0A68_09895 [Flavobacterium reichenbachii]
MKTTIAYLCILMFIISCKGKITNIKITPAENDKNYKSYMQKFGERPRASVTYECPWIKNPENTVYIYMPITFTLDNNTGLNLRISKIWDNYSINQYRPVFIGDKYYENIEGKVRIPSGNSAIITLFVHLPVSVNLLDKSHYDRLFPTSENHKRDSIVMTEINPQLQKEIDLLLKNKQILISYTDSKNVKERALAYYCVNKNKLAVFRSDSLANLKESYIHRCD